MNEFVLKNKNYLLLFIGSVVSNLGTHMYNFAMSLYILNLTDGNAAAAGVYLAFGGIVFFAVSPFSGAIVDRLDKVKVVVITDLINGSTIIVAGILIFSNLEPNTIIVVLYFVSLILGISSSLFNPAVRSLPAHILEENQLQQSSSLSQGMFALYSIIGAVLGGIMYSFISIEYIFIINGVSFILSGISESFISLNTKPKGNHELTLKSTLIDIKEGIKYISKLKPILNLLIIASLLNFFTVPVIVNGFPYLFEIELEADPYYYGVLITSFPIGIVLTSLFLGSRKQRDKVSPLIISGLYGMAFSFSFIALAVYLLLNDQITFMMFMVISYVATIFTGIANGFINIPFSVAIMKVVDKELMGRVFSVTSIISNGLSPIAIALGGFAIMTFGVTNLFYIAVVAMFVTALLAHANKYIREL